MKRYVILVAVALVMVSCGTSKKSPYKSIDQRDVPERYLKDFVKHHAAAKDVRWEMADSTTYFANYKNDNDNDCIVKFTQTSTGMYYVIPMEYLPTDITDYIKTNYAGYKIQKAYITDIKNVKCYEVRIAKKDDVKNLQFSLTGNFNKVIE
mgnify:CR=1 FL=1